MRVIRGGRASGKTWRIITELEDEAQRLNGHAVLFVANQHDVDRTTELIRQRTDIDRVKPVAYRKADHLRGRTDIVALGMDIPSWNRTMELCYSGQHSSILSLTSIVTAGLDVDIVDSYDYLPDDKKENLDKVRAELADTYGMTSV